MTPRYYLGIDGGATTTRARLVDEAGRVLGEGLAGSANLTLGVQVTLEAIHNATDDALANAGLAAGHYDRIDAGLGLAAANVPALAAQLLALDLGFRRVRLASDAEIACLGAHGGADGAILILGTGSQGLAIIHGRSHTLGGWGFHVGDDGSGAVLGRAALRAALRGHEGWGSQTPLTQAIMQHFDNDPTRMVLWAAEATPRDYGQFAPLIFECALQDDAVARALLQESATMSAAMIRALVRMGAERIALMGGLAEPIGPLLPDSLAHHLVAPKADALEGALLLARRAAEQ